MNERIWLRAMEIGAAAGCHQLPDRSFYIGIYQFPVCARCTGVLAGHLLMPLVYRHVRVPKWAALFMCLTTLTDWTAQQLGHESNNRRRFITGLLGGMGTALIYIELIGALLKGVHHEKRDN